MIRKKMTGDSRVFSWQASRGWLSPTPFTAYNHSAARGSLVLVAATFLLEVGRVRRRQETKRELAKKKLKGNATNGNEDETTTTVTTTAAAATKGRRPGSRTKINQED